MTTLRTVTVVAGLVIAEIAVLFGILWALGIIADYLITGGI